MKRSDLHQHGEQMLKNEDDLGLKSRNGMLDCASLIMGQTLSLQEVGDV